MRKITVITSSAAALLMPNIDTDIIAPMKRILNNFEEMGKYAFEAMRFVDGDGDRGEPNPDFVFNQPRFKGAKILLTGENFGCGSSRESAAMGIADMGVECVIGSTFGGIFFKNCFQQAILPIALPASMVEELAAEAADGDFVVDLPAQTVTTPKGRIIGFEIEALRKEGLLEGLDDVGRTLKKKAAIDAFMARDRTARPWVYRNTAARIGQ